MEQENASSPMPSSLYLECHQASQKDIGGIVTQRDTSVTGLRACQFIAKNITIMKNTNTLFKAVSRLPRNGRRKQ
jgi:hypothetical protein